MTTEKSTTSYLHEWIRDDSGQNTFKNKEAYFAESKYDYGREQWEELETGLKDNEFIVHHMWYMGPLAARSSLLVVNTDTGEIVKEHMLWIS